MLIPLMIALNQLENRLISFKSLKGNELTYREYFKSKKLWKMKQYSSK